MRFAALLLCAITIVGCSGDSERWIYWLADPVADTIGDADGAYVVTDYSVDGSDAGAFTADDLAVLSQDGGRPVLSYLSIGEAEDYRDYWDSGWQDILLGDGGYLEQITDAGFDGVYLDIIDAYFYWSEDADAADLRPMEDTADDMIALIEAIGDAGREANPDFEIFPQNGEFVGYRVNVRKPGRGTCFTTTRSTPATETGTARSPQRSRVRSPCCCWSPATARSCDAAAARQSPGTSPATSRSSWRWRPQRSGARPGQGPIRASKNASIRRA